jgi:2-hydroxychromene-2-carboxylate isomerase
VVRPTQPVFYYDLGDPECYLVAERINSELPVIAEWVPVLTGEGSRDESLDREEISDRARELGLQPIRWPATWPPDSRDAMVAATYAKHIGRGVAFSLAVFRQQFAGGRDVGDRNTVLIAAAACEMHPTAVLKGIGLRSVSRALETACARAAGAGVRSLPTIQVADELFATGRCIKHAVAALGAHR